MVRIRVKGVPYTNTSGLWRKVYKTKGKKEYIILKGKKKFL